MDRLTKAAATTALTVAVAVAAPLLAQQVNPELAQATEASPQQHQAESTEGGHETSANSVGLFLGVTNEPGHDAQGTWGLEYTRLVTSRWGVGAVAEYAGGDLRNTVLIAFVAWMPWQQLELFAGPGIELHDGRSSDDSHSKSDGEGEADKDQTYFVVRLGVGWHVHLSHRVGLIPAVYLDLVEGEKVWIYGLNWSYRF